MGGAAQVAMHVTSQIWQVVFASQTLQVFCLALRKKAQYVVVCMKTLRFGQLPNSCEPLEKECKSESEYCITTKKVKICWLCHSR
jgi:hypothetical protein